MLNYSVAELRFIKVHSTPTIYNKVYLFIEISSLKHKIRQAGLRMQPAVQKHANTLRANSRTLSGCGLA